MPNQANIKQAYAMINGQKVIATYDETTGLYTVETTAPAESSWSQPDHVYQVTLHAEDVAGNTVAMSSTDETYGDQLKIRVLEKTKPVAEILNPTQDAILGDSTQTIELRISDAGGSGLNLSTVEFVVNDVTIEEALTWVRVDAEGNEVDETYEGTDSIYTAEYVASGLSNGVNSIRLKVTDNDGNVSDEDWITFVISTVAPLLTVITPTDNLITNSSTVTVTGKTKTANALVSITGVTVNDAEATLSTEPDEDGYYAFTYEYTLQNGVNTITVVATDNAGKTTTIRRTVTLDTEAPVITDVHTEAVTVDASGMIRITFKVTDHPIQTED